ncbi:hypothetical protein [Streptomyces sp. NPDC056255]|uniref:hypothetical protein n=1 Tax=Streptomyces sp. NPDC056255 TaxID=3345764 RepID=UPI0035D6D4B4
MPFHHVLSAPVVAITRTVTVAAGRFALGHLGELTAVVPFELVDAVQGRHACQSALKQPLFYEN